MKRFRQTPPTRGAAAVEFALMLPILMLMLSGFVEFGYAFYVKGMLATGVREGSRVYANSATGLSSDKLAQATFDAISGSLLGGPMTVTAADVTITTCSKITQPCDGTVQSATAADLISKKVAWSDTVCPIKEGYATIYITFRQQLLLGGLLWFAQSVYDFSDSSGKPNELVITESSMMQCGA